MIPTIDELFYGYINPYEDGPDTPEERQLQSLLRRNKEQLMASFTPEQKELFEKYLDNEAELAAIRELFTFKTGFGLGMQLTMEGMRIGKTDE